MDHLILMTNEAICYAQGDVIYIFNYQRNNSVILQRNITCCVIEIVLLTRENTNKVTCMH